MSMANCPVCDAEIEQEDGMEVSELIECGDCGVELEVTGLDPLNLMEAPQAQEDWGE